MHPRPREEIYDLKKDPDQLVNLAADPEYASVLATLSARVDKVMNASGDPRIKDAFDRLPWVDSTKTVTRPRNKLTFCSRISDTCCYPKTSP